MHIPLNAGNPSGKSFICRGHPDGEQISEPNSLMRPFVTRSGPWLSVVDLKRVAAAYSKPR